MRHANARGITAEKHYDRAEFHYQRSIALNPNDALAALQAHKQSD
jgi:hypothetical protein